MPISPSKHTHQIIPKNPEKTQQGFGFNTEDGKTHQRNVYMALYKKCSFDNAFNPTTGNSPKYPT